MKVVINVCFGGFSVSRAAVEALRKTKCEHISHEDKPELAKYGSDLNGAYDHDRGDARACPYLIEVVESMGPRADGSCSKLRVVEIPDGIEWEIDEYDGN